MRLVETEKLQVISEYRTNQGIRNLNEKYNLQNQVKRVPFFIRYLKDQIQHLQGNNGNKHVVVVSGMASSNIGIKELPYADLPFDHTGNLLNWKRIAGGNSLIILLISGVKSNNCMMRGEEVQAIGLQQHLNPYQRGILILPGTHSKHLVYQEGQFVKLRNFMTGELFEVLSKYSILNKSVSKGNWNRLTINAFKEGLHIGLMGGLTSNLFTIRAYHVLNDYPKTYNYYRLSGMLIGDELSYLKGYKESIFLSATNPILSFYRNALEEVVHQDQLVLLNEDIFEEALLIGQKKILKNSARG